MSTRACLLPFLLALATAARADGQFDVQFNGDGLLAMDFAAAATDALYLEPEQQFVVVLAGGTLTLDAQGVPVAALGTDGLQPQLDGALASHARAVPQGPVFWWGGATDVFADSHFGTCLQQRGGTSYNCAATPVFGPDSVAELGGGFDVRGARGVLAGTLVNNANRAFGAIAVYARGGDPFAMPALHTGFSGDGLAAHAFNGGNDPLGHTHFTDVALTSNLAYQAIGTYEPGSGDEKRLGLVRLTDGGVDAGFGTAGTQLFNFRQPMLLVGEVSFAGFAGGAAVSMAIASTVRLPNQLLLPNDGAFVLAAIDEGAATVEPGTLVIKLMPNGQFDPSFGSAGAVRLSLLDPDLAGFVGVDQARQGDGKLLIAGHHGDEMRVIRLTRNGALDASFGVQHAPYPHTGWGFGADNAVPTDIAIVRGGLLVSGFRVVPVGLSGNYAALFATMRLTLDSVFADGLETP